MQSPFLETLKAQLSVTAGAGFPCPTGPETLLQLALLEQSRDQMFSRGLFPSHLFSLILFVKKSGGKEKLPFVKFLEQVSLCMFHLYC